MLQSTLAIAALAVAAVALIVSLFRFASRQSPLKFIPGPPSRSWFKGHLGELFNPKGLDFHLNLVEQYGPVVRLSGFFGDEQLYISDPKAMHNIILKEQDVFEETAVFIQNNRIIFGEGLVATTGEQHKRQRKLINPIFSTHQLRSLVPIFHGLAHKLRGVLHREIVKDEDLASSLDPGAKTIDVSAWMSRVALESIGKAGLGYSFDPLDSPANNPYTRTIKELIPTLFSLSLLRQLTPFLTQIGSPALRRRLLDLIPNKALQKIKFISDTIEATSRTILEQKKTERRADFEDELSAMTEGKDIMSVLLKSNENAATEDRLSDSELLGQMSVLIFGAQDTTSSAMTRILYLLSTHLEVQSRLRQEVRAARESNSGSDLDYAQVDALPWLDAIVKETLRLYPPVPFVRRTASRETVLPFSKSLKMTNHSIASSVHVPAGTTVVVGIAAINRSEGIWGADAKDWRPSRWMGPISPSNASKEAGVPSIYSGMMTFLGGGRSCVGYRFALIEMKIILSTLIETLAFSPTNDKIVWNLSQIMSPSVIRMANLAHGVAEEQGLPLRVRVYQDNM